MTSEVSTGSAAGASASTRTRRKARTGFHRAWKPLHPFGSLATLGRYAEGPWLSYIRALQDWLTGVSGSPPPAQSSLGNAD